MKTKDEASLLKPWSIQTTHTYTPWYTAANLPKAAPTAANAKSEYVKPLYPPPLPPLSIINQPLTTRLSTSVTKQNLAAANANVASYNVPATATSSTSCFATKAIMSLKEQLCTAAEPVRSCRPCSILPPRALMSLLLRHRLPCLHPRETPTRNTAALGARRVKMQRLDRAYYLRTVERKHFHSKTQTQT